MILCANGPPAIRQTTRPTLHDVARHAGVSIATVSRALNDHRAPRPELREKVLASVASLGFRPNAIGRRLKTGRSGYIGVLVPSLSNPVFADSVAGAQSQAEAGGRTVLLTCSGYDADRELAAVETLIANRVEGLVLTVADAERSRTLDLLEAEQIPYVLVYNQPRDRSCAFAAVDNFAASREMVALIAEEGHDRVVMVAGSLSGSDRSVLRHAGYVSALSDRGRRALPLVEVAFDWLDLADRLKAVFENPEPPTALFCSNDMIALAAIRSLRELGLGVPQDVSVAGFDGIHVGDIMTPRLTTVIQPARALGEAAAELLSDILAGGKPRGSLLPHVIRRGETLRSIVNRE